MVVDISGTSSSGCTSPAQSKAKQSGRKPTRRKHQVGVESWVLDLDRSLTRRQQANEWLGHTQKSSRPHPTHTPSSRHANQVNLPRPWNNHTTQRSASFFRLYRAQNSGAQGVWYRKPTRLKVKEKRNLHFISSLLKKTKLQLEFVLDIVSTLLLRCLLVCLLFLLLLSLLLLL